MSHTITAAGERQRKHYEEIHDDYERHYWDPTSIRFRRRFIEDVLFEGLDLNDKDVADLACGGGQGSLSLLERFPRARPVGFDISPAGCEAYRKRVGRECHELDLTMGSWEGASFDIAIIQGGLHHCVANLSGAIRTVAALLKPGGLFLMLEPNRQCFLEGARRLWYRMDRYFETSTEAALAHDELLAGASRFFDLVSVRFMGGPAYFLVLNSLVFRIPPRMKGAIAPPLFVAEAVYNRLPGRVWFPYFIARWRRRPD